MLALGYVILCNMCVYTKKLASIPTLHYVLIWFVCNTFYYDLFWGITYIMDGQQNLLLLTVNYYQPLLYNTIIQPSKCQ